jgi:hypothetical protein
MSYLGMAGGVWTGRGRVRLHSDALGDLAAAVSNRYALYTHMYMHYWYTTLLLLLHCLLLLLLLLLLAVLLLLVLHGSGATIGSTTATAVVSLLLGRALLRLLSGLVVLPQVHA